MNGEEKAMRGGILTRQGWARDGTMVVPCWCSGGAVMVHLSQLILKKVTSDPSRGERVWYSDGAVMVQ